MLILAQVYLTDMEYFQEMNAEYEKWFSHKPARSCIAVKQLPKGVKVSAIRLEVAEQVLTQNKG